MTATLIAHGLPMTGMTPAAMASARPAEVATVVHVEMSAAMAVAVPDLDDAVLGRRSSHWRHCQRGRGACEHETSKRDHSDGNPFHRVSSRGKSSACIRAGPGLRFHRMEVST